MFPLALDWPSIVRAILFALFGALTGLIAVILGPTYDNLLVPMLQVGALYPPLNAATAYPSNFLGAAAAFSAFLLSAVVDPLLALVAAGVGLLYLVRASLDWGRERWAALVPRLLVAVALANFTLPITRGILGVAAALYPVVSGWDGGAWTQWVHLAGWGELAFSWDNGALAFVLSFVEFFLVFALILAIGVRDALLAVLLVLLPVFSLFWALRPTSALARRAWLLFCELAFLPCVLVVPLELAVGSPSPVMLVGYLAVAVASPFLLSLAGSHLTSFGFPSGSGPLTVGVQRGLAAGSASSASLVGAGAESRGSPTNAARSVAGVVRRSGTAAFPASAPLAAAEAIGHGGLHLARHVGRRVASYRARSPPMRPGADR